MATLILSTVGTAIAGPIGGAIGSVIGQQIDAVIFAPKPRRGPRLGDLSVQTSSYGTAIPKLFGTMRVAGTVIWATDLIETERESGGGKGQASTTSYDYSASFAVALSARPIRAVKRIWADGKLLRGEAGDFKAQATFRLHTGDEDQAADPLIAAAEGVALAPAFRGIAYALFENLALADYGNRIPSLTFEVEADEGPVTIGGIAAELSDFAIAAEATPALGGYAASGDSVRSAVEALADVVPLSLADRDGFLRLTTTPPAAIAIAEDEERARREIVRRASGSVPDEVTIAYYDLERDYQTGLQRASACGSGGRNTDRRALPSTLSANEAKALAEFRLATIRTARLGAKLRLGPSRASLRPGAALQLAGEAGLWRIRRWTLESAGLDLELVRIRAAPAPDPVPANPGRPVSEADLEHGPTILRLIDLPLGEPREGRPLLLAAAAGAMPGWRKARLTASFDGGETWLDAGPSAAPAVLGIAATALPSGSSTLIDAESEVEVELQHDEMWLENATDEALAGGANLAVVGSELVQFGRADWLGGRRFSLSRLWRGRRGAEWATSMHLEGEKFLLLRREALRIIEAPAGSIGAEASLSASGIGDHAGPAVATLRIAGEALRPPSPVHLRGERRDNGDIFVSWVRRSRLGWAWPNGSGTPLGEEREAYSVTLSGAGFTRTVEIAQPAFLYTAADQAADGVVGAVGAEVAQLGTHAVSRTASITVE